MYYKNAEAENEEDAGDAGSSGDLRDYPQQDEEADSPDLWDNGPGMLPLAPDPISSTGRLRRTPLHDLWTTAASHTSCLELRPTAGRQPLPRRQARARVALVLALHHSTHKA